MSGPSTPQQQPPHFLLDVIILEVKSAKKTHSFLCDVFAKASPAAPKPTGTELPSQGSQLSTDEMHAIFKMGNTRIQFSTATPSRHPVGERNVRIAVLVNTIEKVKEVLDQHHVTSKCGRWEALPGHPRWIEFRDQDGYTWNVSEFVKG